MVKKTVQNGVIELNNTTKVQLRSLDDFAWVLGYHRGAGNQYHLFLYQSLRKRSQPYLIGFNTMVQLHNGTYYKGKRRTYFGIPVPDLDNLGITKVLLKEAFDWKVVETVKLQRKKDSTLVVQDHQVKFLVSY